MATRRFRLPTFLLLAGLLVMGEVLLVVSPWVAAIYDPDVPVSPPGFRTPAQQHARDAAADALRSARLGEPPFQDVYVAHPTGEVVVIYQLTVANELAWQPYRAFAERRLLVIRRGLQALGYRAFRLLIKGPPPSACFVLDYGEYRLIAGQSIWRQATAQDMERNRERNGRSAGVGSRARP